MKLLAPRDTERNPALLTWWSIVHYLSGCAAKQSKMLSFTTWFVVHGLYETKDQAVRAFSTKITKINSWHNTAGDQATAMLGYHFTSPNSKIPFVPIWLGSVLIASLLKVEGGLWVSTSPKIQIHRFLTNPRISLMDHNRIYSAPIYNNLSRGSLPIRTFDCNTYHISDKCTCQPY